ncbi:MAG: Re/Si-specific NAD(P)(+) transhydrogenase subunit alpha [bacterium]
MIISVPSETRQGETRVALVPANVQALIKIGLEVIVESGAGEKAGFPDNEYREAGAQIVSRDEAFSKADIITQVLSFGASPQADADLERLRSGQIIIGSMDPLANPQNARVLAEKGVSAIALELVPRISRAQSMDILSSMATISGYQSVLIGAMALPQIFPMLMTAAGTLKASRVFIMGAGVAGLQACATAKRLGAIVEANDIRPAAAEQIISVGAKPVMLDLDTGDSEDKGGYAKAQGEDFLQRQRELMTKTVAEQDLVITTAAVPGAKSPILVTEEMVKGMKPGSVIVDLAAERGGNCELTELGQTVIKHGVTIIGPENLPASKPRHASQFYGKNLETLLKLLVTDGELTLDFEDEIVSETVIAHNGDVPQARMRGLLDLPPLEKPEPEVVEESSDSTESEQQGENN